MVGRCLVVAAYGGLQFLTIAYTGLWCTWKCLTEEAVLTQNVTGRDDIRSLYTRWRWKVP